jgi:hypothetical protein
MTKRRSRAMVEKVTVAKCSKCGSYSPVDAEGKAKCKKCAEPVAVKAKTEKVEESAVDNQDIQVGDIVTPLRPVEAYYSNYGQHRGTTVMLEPGVKAVVAKVEVPSPTRNMSFVVVDFESDIVYNTKTGSKTWRASLDYDNIKVVRPERPEDAYCGEGDDEYMGEAKTEDRVGRPVESEDGIDVSKIFGSGCHQFSSGKRVAYVWFDEFDAIGDNGKPTGEKGGEWEVHLSNEPQPFSKRGIEQKVFRYVEPHMRGSVATMVNEYIAGFLTRRARWDESKVGQLVEDGDNKRKSVQADTYYGGEEVVEGDLVQGGLHFGMCIVLGINLDGELEGKNVNTGETLYAFPSDVDLLARASEIQSKGYGKQVGEAVADVVGDEIGASGFRKSSFAPKHARPRMELGASWDELGPEVQKNYKPCVDGCGAVGAWWIMGGDNVCPACMRKRHRKAIGMGEGQEHLHQGFPSPSAISTMADSILRLGADELGLFNADDETDGQIAYEIADALLPIAMQGASAEDLTAEVLNFGQEAGFFEGGEFADNEQARRIAQLLYQG